MSSADKVYKYKIPLDKSGSVDKPVYEVPKDGVVYKLHYAPKNVVLVKEEASAHFHRDSVNVTVEEISKDEYKK